MAGNIELKLRIQADLKNAQKSLSDLQRSLDRNTASGQQLTRISTATGGAIDEMSRRVSRGGRNLDQAATDAEGLARQLRQLKSVAGAVTGLTLGAGLLHSLAGVSDEYTSLAARIRLVSSSNENAATTFNSVSQLASATGQHIAATAELYTRMARSLKGAASQTELLRVTETISKAAVVSGATAQESTAAIIQLSQGLASGTLRGEEFNSVSEQMPRIMEMLEKSLRVTRGELRKMAQDGKLTTDIVFRALKESAQDIDAEFSQMPVTIGRAVTELSNAWVGYIGGTNDALGASKIAAGVISGLAGNLDTLMTAVTVVALALGGRKVAALMAVANASRLAKVEAQQLAATELAQARAAVAAAQAEMQRAAAAGVTAPGRRVAAENALTAALVRQTAAENALTMATKARSLAGGLGAGLMGLMGGPMGLAVTGVTLAVTGLGMAYAAAQQREAELEQQHRQTIQTLDDQREKTLSLLDARGKLRDSVSTSDALSQQKSNAGTLNEDSAKLDEMQRNAEQLRATLDALMQSPQAGMAIPGVIKQLEALESRIDALAPKVENLAVAQGSLGDEISGRMVRALNAASDGGKTLNQTLDELSAVGPVQWVDIATQRITENEKAVSDLTDEADKLKSKLEKELANATLTAAQQLELLRDKTIAAALAAGKAPEDIDKLRDSLSGLILLQKQVDNAKASKAAAASAARSAQSQARASESYVSGLEKQAATLGKTQGQVRAYELAEKNLTGTLRARAEAALATIRAAEQKKQADASAERNTQLEAQYLRAAGNESAAAMVELRAQAAKMRAEFTATGNAEGASWLDKLLPVQESKIRIDALKKQIDDLATWRSQQETSVQAQVNSGLITELAGRRELVRLNKETTDKLASYLPQIRELSVLPGVAGDNARALLAQLESEMSRLKVAGDGLASAFSGGLQNGIEGSLNALAQGTDTLSEAVLNLAKSVLDAMAQVASRNLSELTMQGLDAGWSALSGGSSAAADTAASAAGAQTFATAITAAAGTGAASMGASLTGGATAMSAALTTGTTALTTAMSAAFASGAGTIAAAITSASAGNSAMSGIAGAVTAATGGHIRGPGTGTSDSIAARLSNGEYVIRAAIVKQYGPDFFHALNSGRYGKFADGGMVSAPRVSVPRISNAVPDDSAPRVQSGNPVIQQTLVLDAADAFTKGAQTVAGQRAVMTVIRANKQTLKQELGIK